MYENLVTNVKGSPRNNHDDNAVWLTWDEGDSHFGQRLTRGALGAIETYLKQATPPTPEDRARSVLINTRNVWNQLNNFQMESLEECIATEIRLAESTARESAG